MKKYKNLYTHNLRIETKKYGCKFCQLDQSRTYPTKTTYYGRKTKTTPLKSTRS